MKGRQGFLTQYNLTVRTPARPEGAQSARLVYEQGEGGRLPSDTVGRRPTKIFVKTLHRIDREARAAPAD